VDVDDGSPDAAGVAVPAPQPANRVTATAAAIKVCSLRTIRTHF